MSLNVSVRKIKGKVGRPPKSLPALKFYKMLAHVPIHSTLTSTKKCGCAPGFHLLITCREVKFDGLRAVLLKVWLGFSLCITVLLLLALRDPCWKASR